MLSLSRDQILQGIIDSMELVIQQPVHAVDAKAVAAAVSSLTMLMLAKGAENSNER
jgi:hypothetical protein